MFAWNDDKNEKDAGDVPFNKKIRCFRYLVVIEANYILIKQRLTT